MSSYPPPGDDPVDTMGAMGLTDLLKRDHTVVDPRRFELIFDGRPPTVNDALRKHRMAMHRETKEWRDLACAKAKFELRLHKAGIARIELVEVKPECRKPPLPDTAAAVLVVKAIIDGLVDAGVVPDDDPRYVGAQLHHPAALSLAGRDRLVVVLHCLG